MESKFSAMAGSHDSNLMDTYVKMEDQLVKDIARTKNHTETSDKLMASMESALTKQTEALKASIASYKTNRDKNAKSHNTLQDLMGTLNPNHIKAKDICAEKTHLVKTNGAKMKPLKDALKLKLMQLDGPEGFKEAVKRVKELEKTRRDLSELAQKQEKMWNARIDPIRATNKKLEAELHELSVKELGKHTSLSKEISDTISHVMALAAKCK